MYLYINITPLFAEEKRCTHEVCMSLISIHTNVSVPPWRSDTYVLDLSGEYSPAKLIKYWLVISDTLREPVSPFGPKDPQEYNLICPKTAGDHFSFMRMVMFVENWRFFHESQRKIYKRCLYEAYYKSSLF